MLPLQDKNGKDSNAFRNRMGARGPKPRLLRLKPEDVAKVGGAALSKAKFSWVTEGARQERWIVASVGSYTALWNLRCAVTCACSERQGAAQKMHASRSCYICSTVGLVMWQYGLADVKQLAWMTQHVMHARSPASTASKHMPGLQ